MTESRSSGQARHHLKGAVTIAVSLACFAFVVVEYNLLDSVDRLRSSNPAQVMLVLCLLAGAVVLTYFRFRFVLAAFGFRVRGRTAVLAFSAGHVSNAFLFNVIGQSISRATILSSGGVPANVTVTATYLERVIAAGLLFLLSVIGVWLLFVDFEFRLDKGGAHLLSILGGLAIVMMTTTIVVGRHYRANASILGNLKSLVRFWPVVTLTLAGQGCMVGSYLVALRLVGVDATSIDVIGAILIVMFTASLPISFSGWGIRELSAATALGAANIVPDKAVAAAISIGVLSLVLVLMIGVLAAVLISGNRNSSASEITNTEPIFAADWNRMVPVLLVMGTALLLFYQLHIPLQTGEITVNLGDILAATAVGIFLMNALKYRTLPPLPASAFVGLAGLSIALVFSLSVSLIRFGANDWALMNRGVGWVILLGYVGLGAMVGMIDSRRSLHLVLLAFVIGGCAIATMQLGLLLIGVNGLSFPESVFNWPLRGYAGNANAYGFQLIVILIAALVLWRQQDSPLAGNGLALVVAVLGATIYFTQSRTGYGMLLIVLVSSIVFSPRYVRREISALFGKAILLGAAVLFIIRFSPEILHAFFGNEKHVAIPHNVERRISTRIVDESSENERWESLAEAWRLWLTYPWLGGGLGAFVQNRVTAGREFLVIHCTPLWVLAEMGLAGFVIFSASFFALLKPVGVHFAAVCRSDWTFALVTLMLCFGGANLVHDFFFQRFFWFFLGFYLALIYKDRCQPSSEGGTGRMSETVTGTNA